MTDEIPSPTEDNPFRNISYIAKVTGFKSATIRMWLKEGKLKGFQVRGEWRVTEAELKKFLQGRY